MRHGSLFSGIGGFDLAAQWMGWENVFQVEWDGFCQKVLAKNFPNVKRYGDIREFDGTEYRGRIDIISGGFPCQPFSVAGKRKGKNDDRYLWPEYLRIIQQIKPAYVVGENVFGLYTMDDGKTLEGIFSDLEGQGYSVESFIIPACAVGAWHRRDRIWILAYPRVCSDRTKRRTQEETQTIQTEYRASGCGRMPSRTGENDSNCNGQRKWELQSVIAGENQQDIGGKNSCDVRCLCKTLPNSPTIGLQGCKQTNGSKGQECDDKQFDGCHRKWNEPWEQWSTEPLLGRVAYGIPNRMDRIKGLGNAIVPQVAFEIFKAIDSIHES